jgi:methyl-accepting chemotaxis protein
MNKFKKLPFVVRTIITTVTLILLVGILLIGISIKIQKDVLTSEMEKQAVKIAERWGEEIDSSSVEEAVQQTNYDDEVQKELTAFFDSISANNPNIAQGYIFSTDINAEGQSTIISVPSNIIEMLKENDMKIGELYEHPEAVAKSINELNETKEITTSEIYEDPFGTWVTALYPIKNKSGEVTAFFGFDIDASMVKNGGQTFLLQSLLILVPTIIVVVLLQIIVLRRSAGPLRQLLGGINEMRKGNLDIHLPTREDDLGKMNEAFNEMALELKEMINKISDTSKTVLQSSQLVANVTEQSKENSYKVSENINQMAAGIQTQESSITESSGAIEQIASEIESIATSSQDVALVSKDMESYAHQGITAIQNVVAQMETINQTVNQSNRIISSLKVRSDEISSILEVITGISDQTNLLALNAAIEAARAGEHGKGFAVVAEEVRKLAEESSQSSGRISKIIEQIQSETNNAVNAMGLGTKEAEKGREIAHSTGELFDKMKQFTDQIANQIEGVSAASQEISSGTEEVSASSKELTSIAKSNSTLTSEIETSTVEQLQSVNQLSDAAKELNELAQELQNMITRFNA